jgi:hypothetical protein
VKNTNEDEGMLEHGGVLGIVEGSTLRLGFGAVYHELDHDWMWTCIICKSYGSLGWLAWNEQFALHRIMCAGIYAVRARMASCSSKQEL